MIHYLAQGHFRNVHAAGARKLKHQILQLMDSNHNLPTNNNLILLIQDFNLTTQTSGVFVCVCVVEKKRKEPTLVCIIYQAISEETSQVWAHHGSVWMNL